MCTDENNFVEKTIVVYTTPQVKQVLSLNIEKEVLSINIG